MRIAFFSELPFKGKIDRTYPNMRTEFAWMCALNADHIPLSALGDYVSQIGTSSKEYDLGIVIFPKDVTKQLVKTEVVHLMKRLCTKVGFMQEGPSWYFQSLELEQCFWFANQMAACDFVLAHNDIDKVYYEGLLDKPTFINPTLMLEDLLHEIDQSIERRNIIIGGNIGEWYGGFDSLAVIHSTVQEDQEEIWLPRMGRMKSDELYIPGLHHLPYLTWIEWIKKLNQFKYAIHLIPNTIGGTFSLNCAYLGIPCIGNIESDTQRRCFPDLSVDVRDLRLAKTLFKRLYTDYTFYSECSLKSKENFVSYYSEKVFLHTWEYIYKSLIK